MKRRVNTLDAEYKRRGLIRPNQAEKWIFSSNAVGRGRWWAKDAEEGYEFFNWRGTKVWGVKA